MDYSDFGQIDIYNSLFNDIDTKTIKYTPMECIEKNLSYCAIYNDRELPIMIGSKFDLFENPLDVKGYFIIDGICKSVNNIKMYEKQMFSKDRCYISNNSRIDIKNMFEYTITNNGSARKWTIPLNWKNIIQYSDHKEELEEHLTLINCYTKDKSNVIKEEIDLIALCYMFECWLGLREEPVERWRLITAGELIYDIISKKGNVIKCFRNNTWSVKYIRNVNSVSEDMKHYNNISDIESIRRITLPTQREHASMNRRSVKDNDKYKICPVQTSDGSLCGTVNYLCKGARVTMKEEIKNIISKNDKYYHTFINSQYNEKQSIEFINEQDGEIERIGNVFFIYNNMGRVIKGDCLVSYAASLIPFRNNNPPIRSMFSCSMLKQAITGNYKTINNTKILINGNLGHDLNVAIMPWKGYNIEDAIVISKSASIKFKSKKIKIYRENDINIIGIYVKKNQSIKKGDLLYKTYNPNNIKTIELIYSEQDGIIEDITSSLKYIKIVITKTRNLEVGDKMTSRHGQKGVVSLILKDEDMPYYINDNNETIRIELMINPHAFPSRMTMGQIHEMGNEEEDVFIKNKKYKIIAGKCLYMALRHQVDDKIQYRNSGNMDIITRQPIEGKRNNGGLRFGQMERDILIGLGAWKTLKELWSTDITKIYVCPKTGIINPDCCKITRDSHQYFKICLSYIRALGHDILIKKDTYSIVDINKKLIKETKTLNFGDLDPMDIRLYKKKYIVLPICLRSIFLNKLYVNNITNQKEIEKETKKLLKSKKGAYHKYVEGHRIDNCLRSVITPDPSLDINTVKIPFGANINTSYGILNRQPTLNIDSMRIVKLIQSENKTISFNPLLCKSFNADFDGDEMNIYGIKNKESIKELQEKMSNRTDNTQDYIIGINKIFTANKKGIKMMIDKESKGKRFNYDHMYNKIGEIKIYNATINENYYDGIKEDNWYILCKLARDHAASIGINTPITGHLESICNQMFT